MLARARAAPSRAFAPSRRRPSRPRARVLRASPVRPGAPDARPRSSLAPAPAREDARAAARARARPPRASSRDADGAGDARGGARRQNEWPPPADETKPLALERLALVAACYCGACYVAMAFAYGVVPSLDLASAVMRDTIGAPPDAPVLTLSTTVPGALKFMNMFGTAMYAHAGTITAGSRGMDLMGCALVGCVTAVGGGTTRQILLGDAPVFWATTPEYVALAVIASIATFYLWPRLPDEIKHSREMRLVLNVTDAIALGCFVVVGANAALTLGFGALVGVVSALVTSCLGGVLRDVCCSQPIRIMHAEQELYGTCVCFGSALFLALAKFCPDADVAVRVFLPVAAVALSRALAWSRDIKLPTYADRDPFAGVPSRRVL